MGKKKMFINNNNVSANPNQITEVNQIAWYDFTDETTLTLSTDLIQTVTDKYGNHNLTSPSGKEPTLEDGFAKFNTDGKQLIASTTFPSNLTSTGFYVFMRWKDAELNGGLNGAGMILSSNNNYDILLMDRYDDQDVRLSLRNTLGTSRTDYEQTYKQYDYNNREYNNYFLIKSTPEHKQVRRNTFSDLTLTKGLDQIPTLIDINFLITLGLNDSFSTLPFAGKIKEMIIVKGDTPQSELDILAEYFRGQQNYIATYPEIEALIGGIDVTPTSFYWFRPYLTTDFQAIATPSGITKDYFYLYSSDHGSGEIYLAEGDDLQLTNFTELGLVKENYESETPYLIKIDDAPDSEIYHLFYHTNSTDPNNEGTQQTRLYTTANQSLLNVAANWTDRDNVLGLNTGETHTGYIRPYKRGVADYLGHHLTKGSPGEWSISESLDGRTWSRSEILDLTTVVPFDGFRYIPTSAHFFDYNGNQYCITTIQDLNTLSVSTTHKIIAIFRAYDYKPYEYLGVITNHICASVEAYIDGDTAHLYYTNPKQTLHYNTFDLNQLLSGTINVIINNDEQREVFTESTNQFTLTGVYLDAISSINVQAGNLIGVSVSIINKSFYELVFEITTNAIEQLYTVNLVDGGTHQINVNATPSNFLYDNHPFAFGWGLTKLNSNSVYFAEIQRSTDSAITKLMWNSSDTIGLDSMTDSGDNLGTWANGGDVRCKEIYNQGDVGSNGDLIQSIFANMAYIVKSGVLVTHNTHPSLESTIYTEYDSRSSTLTLEGIGGEWSALGVGKFTNATNNMLLMADNAERIAQFLRTDNNEWISIAFNQSGAAYISRATMTPNDDYIAFSVMDGSNIELFKNNVSAGATPVTGIFPINKTTTLNAFYDGANGCTGFSFGIILWTDDKSADRIELQDYFNDIYNVY